MATTLHEARSARTFLDGSALLARIATGHTSVNASAVTLGHRCQQKPPRYLGRGIINAVNSTIKRDGAKAIRPSTRPLKVCFTKCCCLLRAGSDAMPEESKWPLSISCCLMTTASWLSLQGRGLSYRQPWLTGRSEAVAEVVARKVKVRSGSI